VAILIDTTMRLLPVFLSVLSCAALAGCGDTSGAAVDPPAATPTPQATACAATAVGALRGIAENVYGEDADSATERADLGLVLRSVALRDAAISRDPAGASQAARALIATGHVARLRVTVGGHVLADVGARPALAPVAAAIRAGDGATIASVRMSIESTAGFVSTADALTGGSLSVRVGSGPSPTGARSVPEQGLVRVGATTYAVSSFAVSSFAAGPARATLVRSLPSLAADCGSTRADTLSRVLGQAMTEIYRGEIAGATLSAQAERVAHSASLLSAVAARDPVAIRAAIVTLLHQHIVRVRVLVPGLAAVDVGGPYVLAPTRVALRQNGRTIGSAEVSIQDVLGLVLLSRRLIGVQVVVALPSQPPVTAAEIDKVESSSLRVGGYRVVLRPGTPPLMSTLADPPPALPSAGSVRAGGQTFSVFSFTGRAFPSQPLRIWALAPAG